MVGGSKPKPGNKLPVRSQDGARNGGGIGTRCHAGLGRASKQRPVGTKGAQLRKRTRP